MKRLPRKRDAAQKKKEFQIKYLRENIKFLYEIKIRSVACGDKIENYLSKVDPRERDNQYNNVEDSIYEVKAMLALEGYDVKCFMKYMGLCIIGTESFEIEKHVENMQKLLEQYYHESYTEEIGNLINVEKNEIIKIVDRDIEGVTDELVRLIKE